MTYHPTDSDDDGTVEADVDNTSVSTESVDSTNPYQRAGNDLYDWQLLDTFRDGTRSSTFDYTYSDGFFDLMRVTGVVSLESTDNDIKFRVGGDSGQNYDYVVRNGSSFSETNGATEWQTQVHFSRMGVFDYIFMESPNSHITSGSSGEDVVMYGRSIHATLLRDDLVQGVNGNASFNSINVFTDGSNEMAASIKVFGFDFDDWVVA